MTPAARDRALVSVPAPTLRERLAALALALACAVAFLGEALLPGRALVPHPPELLDVAMAESIAAGRHDATEMLRGNVGQGDKYWQSACWNRVLADGLAQGTIPGWTRAIGGGAPFLPQMAQPFQPVNALLLVLPPEQAYGWSWLLQQVLCGCLAWSFLRRLGCGQGGALFGLVAASLGTWTQCKLHHDVVLTAALGLWPMLTATWMLVAVRTPAPRRWIAWLALWTGQSWSSGFPIVSAFGTWLVLAWAAWLAGTTDGTRWRGLGRIAVGLALGAALAAATLVPVLAAHAESARRAEHAPAVLRDTTLEADHLLTLAWPDLFCRADDFVTAAPAAATPHAITRPLWSQLLLLAELPPGSQGGHGLVETSFAPGLVALALATLAFARRRRGHPAWFFGAATLVAFGFAAGVPPLTKLGELLPGLDAGNVRRSLVVAGMGLVVLAGLGADALAHACRRRVAQGLLAAVALTSLVAVVWTGQTPDDNSFTRSMAGLACLDTAAPWVKAVHGDADQLAAAMLAAAAPGEAWHNHDAVLLTAGRALTLALIAFALLLRTQRPVPWLIALAALELLHLGRHAVVIVAAERVTTPPRVLAPLVEATPKHGERPRLARLTVADAHRVDAALPGNFPGSLGLEDASFYSPLAPRRGLDFFRAIEPQKPGRPDVIHGTSGFGAFHDARSLQHPLCDLFGIRFVLTHDAVAPATGLVDRTPPGTGGWHLLERTTTLPRATFLHTVDLLPERTQRLQALAHPDRDVARRVVLEDAAAPAVEPAPTQPATVSLVQHTDEHVAVRVATEAAGWLRLADPFDAGWQATIDGTATPIFVADHWLRAVHVPRGEHVVAFTWVGPYGAWPERTSLAALLLSLWLLRYRRARA